MSDERDRAAKLLEAVEVAWTEVGAICSGRRRFTMSIPAEPTRDSDLVITEALSQARELANLILTGDPLERRDPPDVTGDELLVPS